jgi:hypothetical protein
MAKKSKGGRDFSVSTPGRIQTPVKAFDGDITGTPSRLSRYSDPKREGTSNFALRRPGGAKEGGGNIKSVTMSKGKKS